MAETRITNNNGATSGFIRDSGQGKTIHNANGTLVGKYDQQNDKTYSETGKYVGAGDQLMRLLGR